MDTSENLDFEFDIKQSGMNKTELMLLEAMKKLGLDPKPQFKISRMTVDFAFPVELLAIEINGPYHDTEEQQLKDKKRWFMLKKLGWKRKSFNSSTVYDGPESVAFTIKNLLEKYGGYVSDKALMKQHKISKSDQVLNDMWDKICGKK